MCAELFVVSGITLERRTGYYVTKEPPSFSSRNAIGLQHPKFGDFRDKPYCMGYTDNSQPLPNI